MSGRAAQRHRLALLALLSTARGRGLTRERAIALLWPDADPDQGRRLLSDSIYRINKAVGGDAIVAVGDELRLEADRATSDVAEFQEAISSGDWERAARLHTGAFLDGFYLPDAGDFERWTEEHRQRLRRDLAKALESLASAREDEDPAGACHWWRTLAAVDPYSSRVALRLMQCLDRAGDPAGAVRHGASHTALVREDLGLEPDPEVPRFAQELRDRSPTAPEAWSEPETVPSPSRSSVPRAEALPADAPPSQPKPDLPTSNPQPDQPASNPQNLRRTGIRWPIWVPAVLLVVVAFFWTQRTGSPTEDPGDEIRSVIVLPFSDLSPDGTEERLADGITEELINRLSRTELRVVGRTSAFAFKGQTVDARAIGERLDVGAVLDGSVRRSGDRLRISVQLSSTTDGFQLWSETYERTQSDLFEIQDEIARSIVVELTGSAPEAVPMVARPLVDPETYNLYLSGRFEWHRRTEASLLRAVEYLEQATARAPGYARAQVGLGDAYAVLGFYDYLPPAQAFPRAGAAARRAIELAPNMAEPYATLGYVSLYWDWDGPAAEQAFLQSIARSPGYSTGHQWYANLLTAQGRFDEALREMLTATELDPLSLIANMAVGWVHYYAGDYEAALDQLNHARTLGPEFELSYLWAGLSHEALGNTEASLTDLRRAVGFSESAITRAALARGLALAGEEGQARAMLERLEDEAEEGYAPAFEIAKVYAGLGEGESAMAWLQRAYDERSHSMVFLGVDPQLTELRSRDDFRAMVDAVGIGGP